MIRNKSLSIFFVVFFIGAMFLHGCSTVELPKLEETGTSRIYDRNNKVISTIFRNSLNQVSIKKIPDHTQKAFIAVEDARFYKHFGLDPIRIAAAAWNNFRAGKIVQGGSTITQQTVKNLYLTREKTFGRKFVEAWLAIQLEQKYSKQEILEIYLNQIYFGHGAYGIEAAARTYFNKSSSQLDLAESALLAGLPKAPNTYSPFQNWEGAKQRQKTVLNRMVETSFITREAADKAAGEKLVLSSGGTYQGRHPYVVNEVVKYITDKYENGAKMLFSEGISVYTSIDLEMQKAAEESFSKGLAGKDPDLEGALVAIDPSDGQIRAMVGGRGLGRSKFNRATQARRQPGSAFKPFLYAAAIDKGYTQGTTLICEPVEYPLPDGSTYKPTDYGDNPYHYRPFTLRQALAISDNSVAVKLANEINPASIVDYARRMGIKSSMKPYLSLALGTFEVTPLELTGAYCTLASNGVKTEPLLITKITDSEGKILEENKPRSQQVLPAATAYLVTDMMTSVLQQGGTASPLSGIFPHPAAGKTGTTQDFRDAWFVGFTPRLVTGVWIGFDNPKQTVGIPGGRIAGPIWANFMARALREGKKPGFTVPPGIVQVRICADSGLLATPYSANTLPASYLQGTEPTQTCDLHYYPQVPPTVPGETYRQDLGGPQGTERLPGVGQRLVDWFFER